MYSAMAREIIFFLAFLICVFSSESEETSSTNDDIGLNITTYVPKYGYPLESHEIQTDDGYLLTLHRIPHGKLNANQTQHRPPVLIMHGLLESSIDWLNSGPEKGLGFLLADAGYDVWLGNQRGNTWGRKHIKYDPVKNKSEFWDFSFHEIGYYDIAKKIDYIREQTGVEQLFFIGHSQGNTAFFALMSEKPEYNSYIKLAINLGPVAYLNNTEHAVINMLAPRLTLVQLATSILEMHEFFPHYEIVTEIGRLFCVDGSPFQSLCADIFYFYGGYDSHEMNKTLIPIIISNCPAGSSVKQLFHFLQERASGSFQQYDYGFLGNLAKYRKLYPPQYNVSKITAPVVLYSAKKDLFCNPKDVDHLASQLPNLVDRFTITTEDFGHLDYIWGVDAVQLVYTNIFQLLNTYR